MEFRLLGPFEAWLDGVEVPLGDLQQRLTLAVLVLNANRPVSTGKLIDTVWAGAARMPANPDNLISGYIARLRRAFREAGEERELIERTATGYRLRVDEDDLDVNRMRRLHAEATAASRSGRDDLARELLHSAVALRRGPFLEDLDHDRLGGVRVIPTEDAYIDALGDLAELELAAGNHRWVRDNLRSVVSANPTHQRLAALLMRALLANGDRVQAVDVYQQLRAELLDEYGIEPDAALRSLNQLAKRDEFHSSLPRAAMRFTGRVEELALIESRAQLAQAGEERRTLWISGMPGVGKTALAVQAAHRLRRRFPDGQLFVNLNGFTPGAEPMSRWQALGQLLTQLGVPPEQVPNADDARLDLYQARLEDTRTLVVLDNAASEEQVRPLLPEGPGCFTVVTSRRIGGLEATDAVHLEPLPPRQAAELFVNLVGDDRVRGRPDLVDRVVARCWHMPMQIRPVAARFRRHRRWSLEHLAELLEQADGTGGDEATIAYAVSYQHLSDQQRDLFRMFGLWPGPDLSAHGAAALVDCGVPLARAMLEELHAVSLIEETLPGRYQMLDPLKEYASTAPASGAMNESEALVRLLDFYLVSTAAAVALAFAFDRTGQPRVARRCRVARQFADQQGALEWLAVEQVNLVAAIRYAAGHGQPEHTWQLAVLLWRYFYTAGHVADWTETLELARRTVGTNDTYRLGRAHILLRLANARWRAGQPDQALELAAEALPIWVRLGGNLGIRGEADTLCAIALINMSQGEHRAAIEHYEEALPKYRKIGDERGEANALGMLGLLDEERGDFERAERRHLEAAELLRAIGHIPGLISTTNNLGYVRQRLGQLDQAMSDHEQAHELAVRFGDPAGEATALTNLGNTCRLRGRLDEALSYHEQARKIVDVVGNPALRVTLNLDFGATYLARGEFGFARRSYLTALDLVAGTGDRGKRAHADLGVARVLHATGAHDDATTHWQDALAAFDTLGWPEAGEIRAELHDMSCNCARIVTPTPSRPA